MATKYIVKLTADERAQLERMVSTGKRAAQALIHARILLKADVGDGEPFENERIARAVETSVGTVYRVRQLFVEEGMDAALYRKPPKRHYDRKLDGEKEVQICGVFFLTTKQRRGAEGGG